MGADLAVARQFGENLRRARRRADLSQEQLGLRASLHRTAIGLLERGARMPRIDTLLKLATALEIPPDKLIEGIAWTPGTTEAGAFTVTSRVERHAAAMERAAALRAGQKKTFDVVELVREGREELARRGERRKEPEKEE